MTRKDDMTLEGRKPTEITEEPYDPDGLLQDKYRVFHAPKYTDGHPADVRASYSAQSPHGLAIDGSLVEVKDFTFVLKPGNDHHARVALAAYAASCAIEKPQLSTDLFVLLGDEFSEWEE